MIKSHNRSHLHQALSSCKERKKAIEERATFGQTITRAIKGVSMRFKELKKILKDLSEDKRKKIVEGKRDREALQQFKVENIQTIKSKPLREITSNTDEEEVIILTDYDDRGKKLSQSLIKKYRAEGVKASLEYKKKLGRLRGISEIEEIPSKYRELSSRSKEKTEVNKMGKTYIDTIKYIIKAEIETNGIVEKPDVVGAIFGQTEGLLGDELDLRELQKSGRIGRIEVDLENKTGKTVGTITVPSSLDADKTSALAASLEQIERVGPSKAKINVKELKDTRAKKREKVIERAKELRNSIVKESRPEAKEISKAIREGVRQAELQKYGEDKLAAGPDVDERDEIIVVEGRADVINLLKSNIKNVICLHGKKIPNTVKELSKRKTITLFTDGDRGGKLVAKQLADEAHIDYIAKAPAGKEVEELTQKEMLKSLRKKKPFKEFQKEEKIESKNKNKSKKNDGKSFGEVMDTLKGELKGALMNEDDEIIAKVDVKDLSEEMKKHDEVKAVVFDGIITQKLVDTAKRKGIRFLVGTKKGKVKNNKGVNLLIRN